MGDAQHPHNDMPVPDRAAVRVLLRRAAGAEMPEFDHATRSKWMECRADSRATPRQLAPSATTSSRPFPKRLAFAGPMP
jgi:hypothetical protein